MELIKYLGLAITVLICNSASARYEYEGGGGELLLWIPIATTVIGSKLFDKTGGVIGLISGFAILKLYPDIAWLVISICLLVFGLSGCYPSFKEKDYGESFAYLLLIAMPGLFATWLIVQKTFF